MPKMHISKSIEIESPVEKVYSTLIDFNQWRPWSPWLIQEPETVVKVDDDKKYYEWEGKRVGSGSMQITDEKENQSIDYVLTFLKPWKSTADVRFEMESSGDTTRVTWLMDSSLPFFLFWMKKMTEAFIGMDYERGLGMLKEYIEQGKVHSKLDFTGRGNYAGCSYIGISTSCNIDEIGIRMKDDFTKLIEFTGKRSDLVDGKAFSIYHKWDMVNSKVHYTAGFPFKNVPEDLPEGMITGTIPQTDVYTVQHTGPYLHLGNAWSTLYTMQRNKEFKANKKIHPFETYLNLPGEVEEKELITEVHIPVN